MIAHTTTLILAVAAKGEWWEILAALATPAAAVCTYIGRQSSNIKSHLDSQDVSIKRHLDSQDELQREHGERLSRLEGRMGLNPHVVEKK